MIFFALLESADYLSKFHALRNRCHPNMSFSFEQETNGNLSFLDVEVSRQQGKFVTTGYRKPRFSGVCTHFAPLYKVGIVYIWLAHVLKFNRIGQNFMKTLIS